MSHVNLKRKPKRQKGGNENLVSFGRGQEEEEGEGRARKIKRTREGAALCVRRYMNKSEATGQAPTTSYLQRLTMVSLRKALSERYVHYK